MPSPSIPWTAVENGIHDNWLIPATGLAGTSIIWYGQNSARPADPFIMLKWGSVERVGIDAVTANANPLVLTPIAFTASASQPLAAPAHGLALGDGPVQLVGSPPAPLLTGTNYYAVPVDANNVNLATSFINARNNVTVTITGSGSGTIQSTASTVRAGQEILRSASGPRRVILDVTCFGTSGIGSNGADQILEAAITYQPLVAQKLNGAGLAILKFNRVQSTDGIIDTSVFEPRALLEVTIMLSSLVQLPDTIIAEVAGSGSSGGNAIPFDSDRNDP